MATSSRPGTSGPPSPHGGTSGSAAAAAHEATPAKPTRSGRSRAHLTGRGRDERSSLKRPRKQDLTFVGRGGLSRPSGADRLPACSPGAVGGVAELGAKGERGGAGREAATWARPRGISGGCPARSSRAAQPLRTWRPRAPASRTPPPAGGAQGRRVPRAQACPPRLRAAGAKFPRGCFPVKAPSAHSRLLPTRFFCVLTMCVSSFHLYLGGFRGQYIRSADTQLSPTVCQALGIRRRYSCPSSAHIPRRRVKKNT
ncbi:translation initiation factor IF-2-like [Balaenoptera musculus]|uniref:Translation initiation factor IF-2-like n=1 Tax=Balaenoptera musculus TaxID=9771 RepID=A0A8B8XNU3_BALMU|nr:translation initiation factor IF-2-like [Balaenoptera musculus]